MNNPEHAASETGTAPNPFGGRGPGDDSHSSTLDLVHRLLASAGFEFDVMTQDPEPSVDGTTHHWLLRSNGIADVDAYLCFDAQAAVGDLRSSLEAPDADGLPALGQNGSLVYIVRYTGQSDDRENVYRALGVAGALGGEEE